MILSYCSKCKTNTEIENPRFSETNSETISLLSHYAVCSNKKPTFIKEQETSGLLSQLGITLLSKIHLIGNVLSWEYKNLIQ